MQLCTLCARLYGRRKCCYQRSSEAFSKATVVSISSGQNRRPKRSPVQVVQVVVVFLDIAFLRSSSPTAASQRTWTAVAHSRRLPEEWPLEGVHYPVESCVAAAACA